MQNNDWVPMQVFRGKNPVSMVENAKGSLAHKKYDF